MVYFENTYIAHTHGGIEIKDLHHFILVFENALKMFSKLSFNTFLAVQGQPCLKENIIFNLHNVMVKCARQDVLFHKRSRLM